MPNVPKAEVTQTPITGLGAGAFHQLVKMPSGPIGGGGGPATPVPIGAKLQNGFVGLSYSETISAQGGSGSGYTFSIISGSLPAGLTMSAGVISGTPTTAGTSSFTIKVTDSLGSTGTQAFQIVVTATTPVVPVAADLQGGTVAVAYSEVVTAQGGTGTGYTYAVTAGALPTSTSLSLGGTISGTPTVAGTYTFTVTVTDSAGNTGSQAFQIIIASAATGVSNSGFVG